MLVQRLRRWHNIKPTSIPVLYCAAVQTLLLSLVVAATDSDGDHQESQSRSRLPPQMSPDTHPSPVSVSRLPGRHETLANLCLIGGPPFATLGQRPLNLHILYGAQPSQPYRLFLAAVLRWQ